MIPATWRFAIGSLVAFAQAGSSQADWIEVDFSSERWSHVDVSASMGPHAGRRALELEHGIVWLADVALEDVEIEVQVQAGAARTFAGVSWRMVDARNREYFYLRPHQRGRPDSCQYTPVDHSLAAWQLYGDSSAALDYPSNTWLQLRIVARGDELQVYLDSEQPVLVVPQRRTPVAGGVGLQVGGPAPVHFANFRYRPIEGSNKPTAARSNRPQPGRIPQWRVSSPFSEAVLEGSNRLPRDLEASLSWSTLDTDLRGLANLARLAGPEEGADTVVARTTLFAEQPGHATLSFGFSDRVRVYHDGRLVFAGNDTYRSRDHRFLGTIGLFDRVGLLLDKGANEVSFAVSESFGGWGLMAVLDATEGVRVQLPAERSR